MDADFHGFWSPSWPGKPSQEGLDHDHDHDDSLGAIFGANFVGGGVSLPLKGGTSSKAPPIP